MRWVEARLDITGRPQLFADQRLRHFEDCVIFLSVRSGEGEGGGRSICQPRSWWPSCRSGARGTPLPARTRLSQAGSSSVLGEPDFKHQLVPTQEPSSTHQVLWSPRGPRSCLLPGRLHSSSTVPPGVRGACWQTRGFATLAAAGLGQVPCLSVSEVLKAVPESAALSLASVWDLA